MMPRPWREVSLALVLLALPAAGRAQQDTGVHHAESEKVVVHRFTIPVNEFIRVELAGKATYRVELDGTGIGLRVRPLSPGTQRPRIEKLLSGTGAAGTSLYRLRTFAPGVYEFRSTGGDPTRPVTIRITRHTGS